ncbi:hypothetical protein CPU03_16860 (plasmid) [Edwardsiella tarda]|nr:hypothetical protein CPU03_16860 [Edwardsiella tarda]
MGALPSQDRWHLVIAHVIVIGFEQVMVGKFRMRLFDTVQGEGNCSVFVVEKIGLDVRDDVRARDARHSVEANAMLDLNKPTPVLALHEHQTSIEEFAEYLIGGEFHSHW